MAEQGHTPEPWEVIRATTGKNGDQWITAMIPDPTRQLPNREEIMRTTIARVYVSLVDARRIVACVNALQGADIEKLEMAEPGRLARLIEENWP